MKQICLFILTVFAISSCSEKEQQSPEPVVDSSKLTAKDVTLVNGVLRFGSQKHFQNVINEISTKKEMESWYSNPAFVSLLKRQKTISNAEYDKIGETGEFGDLSDVLTFRGEGDDKILGEIVQPAVLSAVLNSKSYVIVGDSAYHIGINQVTSIHLDENLNNLSGFLDNTKMPGAQMVDIKRVSLNNARVQGSFRRTVDKRRLYASNEIISFGGMGSYREIYIEYLKKNWIGWSRTEAPYLSFTLTATAPGGAPLYHKVEAWNVEIIGHNLSETTWGTPNYYNFNARMLCTVFDNETVEENF